MKEDSSKTLVIFRRKEGCLYQGVGGDLIGVEVFASPAPTTRGKGVASDSLRRELDRHNGLLILLIRLRRVARGIIADDEGVGKFEIC